MKKPTPDPFSPRGKLVFLRVTRLGRLPPAVSVARILASNHLPLVVIEYGQITEPETKVTAEFRRLRLGAQWVGHAPAKLRPLLLWLSALTRLAKLFLHAGRPRLLLAQGLHEQAMAYLLSWMTGTPYAVQVHEVYDRRDLSGINRWFFLVEGMALRRARFLLFPEATRADLYRERYRLRRPLFVVANCPRLREPRRDPDYRERLGVRAGESLVCYAGGIGPSNAIRELVAAMAEVPTVHVCLAGWASPEYRAEIDSAAKAVGATARLHWLGELDENARWELLEGSDAAYCYYQPDELRRRHQATASNKLMEALAVGTPVLTSDSADFRDIVERHDVGVCASGTSPAQLGGALRALLDDELGLRRRSANASDLHQRYFHFERQFAPVLSHFLEWFPEVEDRVQSR